MKSVEDLSLLPAPRSVSARSGTYKLVDGASITCQGDPATLFPTARRLQQILWETCRIRWSLGAGEARDRGATITLASEDITTQGYRLSITPERIHLLAGDAAGAFYGVMTMAQILRQSEGVVPAGEIEDHPDFPSRGVMLDISRDKVPTLETLFALVDQLSEWKVNHL